MYLSSTPVSNTNLSLHNFDGSKIQNIVGQIQLTAKFNEKHALVTFYIMNAKIHTTIGADIIQALDLYIEGKTRSISQITPQITNNLCPKSSSKIIQMFPNLISSEIGEYPNFEHKIVITKDAKPLARSPRQIPLAKFEIV